MARRKAAAPEAEIQEAIGYIRVSTEDQADSGLSMDAQRERIRAQATANGWELVAIHEDAGVSAKSLDRPGLTQALAQLRPGRVLLAVKMDRLTRSIADVGTLIARIQAAGAEWACIEDKFDTSTATGRLILGIVVQMSQWEREVIGERTAAALEQKRVRRERLGTTPLGYITRPTDAGMVVEADPEGQETVRRAREWRAQGWSLGRIAQAFTAEGRQTKRGGRWHPQTVRLLLQERYLETIEAPI